MDWLMVVVLASPVFGTFFPLMTYLAGSTNNIGAVQITVSRDTTVILALILVLILGLFARGLPHSLAPLLRNWPIFLFIGWCMVTSRWAEIPSLSFNRSGRLLIFALYAIFLAEMLQDRRGMKILFYALLFSLMGSLLIIVGYPPLGASSDGRGLFGTWRGGMGHKNSLGGVACLGLIYGICMWWMKAMPRHLVLAICGLATILLVLANSVTTMIASLLIVGILFYCVNIIPMVRDRLMAVLLGIIFGIAGYFVINSLGSILAVFGRDSTLTGRSDVWRLAFMLIDQKPFFGYGHGAWGMPVFAKQVQLILLWPCPHAHNFWIDLRLQLGVPGLCLGIFMWGVAGLNAIRAFLTRNLQAMMFPLVTLVFEGIRSYSETVILDPALNDMFWFTLAYASLAKIVAERRVHSAPSLMSTFSRASHRGRFGSTS
ncbi:hypothetical protein ASG54_23165 [Aureimonas sp. Leaf460]|nr:hypothetical protein ASG62_23895 [Aureimonas sp. Leaf427]KQT62213.1 hypothetical protein ASG54_23165 [Aureimonas sp. Leaf460]